MEPELLPSVIPDFSALASLPVRLSVSPALLLLVFALVIAFWGVMTAMFLYHWRRFPYDKPLLRTGERIYLSVSAVLIAVALFGTLSVA